jgi:hypothetical protein
MERERHVMSWETWLAVRFMHPASMSLVVAAVAVASFVAVRLGSVTPLFVPGPDGSSQLDPIAVRGVAMSLLLGYMVFGHGFSYVGRQKELAQIGIAESPGDEGDLRELRLSRVAGAAGAILGAAIVLSLPGSYGLRLDRADADYFWALLVVPLVTWMLGRAAFFSLRKDRALEEIRARPIDLLRLEPVHIFGRLAVQGAFVWVVGTSIATLLFFGRGMTQVIAPLLGVTLSVAVAVLVLPVRGLGEKIREAKRSELARLTTELERARDAALAGDSTSSGRLADLLAYRRHIESIPESPIDTPTLVRFGMYLLIPLGSWSASAVVERFVDWLLD